MPSQGSPSKGGTSKSIGGVAPTPYKPMHTSLPNKSRAKRKGK